VARKLSARLDDLKGSLERLSTRERLMLGGLASAFVVGVIVVLSYIIVSGLEELEEKNTATRQALRELSLNRGCYLEHRNRVAQLEARLSRTLELNRFVETAASAVGVSIAESSEIAPVDVDHYTQRGVEIKLRKVKIEQLAQLIKELEGSPQIVQITQISVTTRWNQHIDLDVEMVVSTFERRERPAVEPGRRRKRGRS